jgi:hypothetical protein
MPFSNHAQFEQIANRLFFQIPLKQSQYELLLFEVQGSNLWQKA